MSKLVNVIIIHCSYGNPNGNWFPWLKLQVENHGHQAMIPKFPTPKGQSLSSWKEAFYTQVRKLDQQTILVGHSLGAGFILNLLDDPNAVHIKATFLVAGFIGKLGFPDYDLVNESFVCKEFNWQLVKEKAGSITVLHGDNDPYVPLNKGKELATHLQAPLTVIAGGGHLNAESGYTSLPHLEMQIRALLGTSEY